MHHCSRQSAEGVRCPMHDGADSGTTGKPAGACSMRGTCDGPAATFLALLTNHGVLTDPLAISPDLYRAFIAIHDRESLIGRLTSPDSPPPRA